MHLNGEYDLSLCLYSLDSIYVLLLYASRVSTLMSNSSRDFNDFQKLQFRSTVSLTNYCMSTATNFAMIIALDASISF